MKKKGKKNTKKHTKAKDTNTKSDKLLKFLLIILIIILVILLGNIIINGKNIDTDDKKIKELYNYIGTKDTIECGNFNVYNLSETTYNELDNETKLCIAYHNLKNVKSEEVTIKKDKGKDTCTLNEMTFKLDKDSKECKVIKASKKLIDDMYQKIYNKKLPKEKSFKIDNTNICYLDDENYYCGLSETVTYTIGNESTIYRLINSAKKKGRSIIIYDYFLKINNDKCFNSYSTTNEDKECSKNYNKKKNDYKFMKKYSQLYKHTYKFNKETNSYYWVSSEPVLK